MFLKEEINKEWTLFLDRDGVINVRNFEGYITSVADFVFLPHALEGIAKLSDLFGRIIVVTNQQGVGKKIMSMRNLSEIHGYMTTEIQEKGGRIDEIMVATNLKGAENDRRKPLTVMGEEAKEKFPEIDFSKAIMVGDTDSDIRFGMNLGMYTVGVESQEKITEIPHLLVKDLLELYTVLK